MTVKKLIEELQRELRSAIPASYQLLNERYPEMCGFAVCTTHAIEGLYPICQSASELPELDDDDYGYLMFCPAEWGMEGEDDFGEAVERIRNELEALSDEASATEGRRIVDAYLSGILSVFSELEKEGKFGPRSDQRFLTMWLLGDDEEWILKASKKLNKKTMHTAVIDAFE